MQALLKGIRYALRLLRRSPGFTAVAALSLGLGIAALAAIFSIVNAEVPRPMPVAAPEALIAIDQTGEHNPDNIPRNSTVMGLADEPPVAIAWEPVFQDYQPFGSLMVRTEAAAGPLAGPLRSTVSELDPALSVLNVATLTDQVRQSLTGQQTLTTVVGVLGGVALLLAAIGLYGVASHWVGQRTRDIGVRMALGARPAGMPALVLRQSLIVVPLGLTVGLTIAIAFGALLEAQIGAMLVEASPTDPGTLAGVSAGLCLVAVVAVLLPARRAARIEPVIALRQD